MQRYNYTDYNLNVASFEASEINFANFVGRPGSMERTIPENGYL